MKRISFIVAAIVLSLCTMAQSNWTVNAGQDNVFLYGKQHTYMGGFRLGFDYRYDFLNGRGWGLETGLYFRYVARRYYDRNIFGGESYATNIGEDIVDRTFLYSAISSTGYILPLHVTYTHLFYQDWTLTAFAGASFDMEMPQRASVYEQLLFASGFSQKSGSGITDADIRFPIEFGLGFTYRHIQVKLGASVSTGKIMTSRVRFDGSEPSDEYGSGAYAPADLFLTVGYRF